MKTLWSFLLTTLLVLPAIAQMGVDPLLITDSPNAGRIKLNANDQELADSINNLRVKSLGTGQSLFQSKSGVGLNFYSMGAEFYLLNNEIRMQQVIDPPWLTSIPQSKVDNLPSDLAAKVPTTRLITITEVAGQTKITATAGNQLNQDLAFIFSLADNAVFPGNVKFTWVKGPYANSGSMTIDGEARYDTDLEEYRAIRNGVVETFAFRSELFKYQGQSASLAVWNRADSLAYVPTIANGTVVTRSDSTPVVVHPRMHVSWVDEFMGTVNTGMLGWSTSTSGGQVTTNATAVLTAGRPGVLQLSTSTGGTNYAGIHKGGTNGGTMMGAGGGEIILTMNVRIDQLSTGSEEFDCQLGFGDEVTNGVSTDGVYFLYDRNTSVNWQTVTVNNSTATTTASNSAVGVGWYRFTIRINAAGTSATFYIDDDLIATHATNLPGAGRWFGILYKIVKSAGTTAVTTTVDWINFEQFLTSAR